MPLNFYYVKQDEVLRIAGVSANTLRVLEKNGQFPKRRKLGSRLVRWWKPDVMKWAENPEAWGAAQ